MSGIDANMEGNAERKEPTPPVQDVHKTPSAGSRSKGSEPASKSSLDSKGRKKKKEVEIPGVHRVTFTVTIAMAVPTGMNLNKYNITI